MVRLGSLPSVDLDSDSDLIAASLLRQIVVPPIHWTVETWVCQQLKVRFTATGAFSITHPRAWFPGHPRAPPMVDVGFEHVKQRLQILTVVHSEVCLSAPH